MVWQETVESKYTSATGDVKEAFIRLVRRVMIAREPSGSSLEVETGACTSVRYMVVYVEEP